MDYKELIEKLRKHHQSMDAYNDLELAHTLEEAVAAIETMLAEREAAVEKMRGNCDECVNANTPAQEYPCYFCHFSMYGKNGDTKNYWKWRSTTPPDRERMEK